MLDAEELLDDSPPTERGEPRRDGELSERRQRGGARRRLVVIEMDIYCAHVAQHQWRWRYDENGNRVEDVFDPLAQVARQTNRYPLYHAKDGTGRWNRPGVGNGFNFVPFGDPSSDIDFETFFARQGARGYHNPNYEQDNAPGGSADPGRSLRFTHFSAYNMRRLRG